MKWYSLFLSFCVGFTEEAKQKGGGGAWNNDWQSAIQPISNVKKGTGRRNRRNEGRNSAECEDRRREDEKGEGKQKW